MTFVLGADATAGALDETGHKGEGRRVAKSDRPGSPSLLRSWVTRAWGEVWRPHPQQCLPEVAPRGEQIGPEETTLGGSHPDSVLRSRILRSRTQTLDSWERRQRKRAGVRWMLEGELGPEHSR